MGNNSDYCSLENFQILYDGHVADIEKECKQQDSQRASDMMTMPSMAVQAIILTLLLLSLYHYCCLVQLP